MKPNQIEQNDQKINELQKMLDSDFDIFPEISNPRCSSNGIFLS